MPSQAKYKVYKPSIKQTLSTVHCHCQLCGIQTLVSIDNPRKAAVEIGQFRVNHEHVVKNAK